jgi:hypothetical protein
VEVDKVPQHVNLQKEVYLLVIMEFHMLEVVPEVLDKVVTELELLDLRVHAHLVMVVVEEDKELLLEQLVEHKVL